LEGGRRNQQREAAAYSGLIRVLWLARKYEALAEVCRQGLRQAQATNHLLFHQYLSRALVLLGQADEAVAEADKAVDIANDETRFEMRLNRVSILTQAERFSQALAEAQALSQA